MAWNPFGPGSKGPKKKIGAGIDPKMNWLQYGGGGDYDRRNDWQQGSTSYNPNDPMDATSSTNTVGPWTAGAETSGYGQTGQMVTPSNPYIPPEKTNGNGPPPNGNGQKTYDEWGSMMNPYEKTFTAPPGQGAYGTVSAGTGGQSLLTGLGGPQAVDPFTFQAFQADPMAAQDYAGFQTTVDPFSAQGFVAPTASEAMQDPGYQFRLEEGQRALQQSAAAKGMLRTGNTWKDLQRYGQGMATAEYDKVYGRRRGEYQQDYQRQLQENQLAYQRELQGYGTGIQAQQLGEASRMGALQANMGVQAQQFGQGAGAWQQNQRAREAQYGQALQQASTEAGFAEQQANREMEVALQNRSALEREYDKQYSRAMGEYGLDYQRFEANQAKQFNRKLALAELGLSSELG
jgi:hypothetical protein